MENKGLYAIMGILLLALGFSTGFAVAPSENIMINNVTDTEYVYVNNTVEVPVMDNDVFNKIFVDEIEFLEEKASAKFDNKFKESKLEDFLEDAIAGFDNFRSNISISDDGVEFVVIDLGLDNEEDSIVKIIKEYNFDYDKDDSYKKYKGTAIVEGVRYFDESKDKFVMDFSYSLK